MPCSAAPCHAMLLMPCNAVLCHAMLRHAMLHCAVLCRAAEGHEAAVQLVVLSGRAEGYASCLSTGCQVQGRCSGLEVCLQ